MSRVPGTPLAAPTAESLRAMAALLVDIHRQQPRTPFRDFQSWAWPAKWVVPPWTAHPDSWERAFAILRDETPTYAPTFLHRDFSHRNLLWRDERITGVVDWVEASTGPAWLDAGHAATNLALAYGPDFGHAFVELYANAADSPPAQHWLIMDAVGFLPAPGRPPLFGSAEQLSRLDAWLSDLVSRS